MPEFDMPYYTPMDQKYHHEFQRTDQRTLEGEPIFPIHLIGQTVPEQDPTGRTRNIVEGVDAAFRGGAGNIQIVMQFAGQKDVLGGGTKVYGEEVREAIREIQKATGGKITGVELPVSRITNLSGFSQQGFSEEERRTALDEVRDTIKFVGDIAGGGSVDIVSFEFPRNFSDASWANRESEVLHKREGDLFKQREDRFAMLVDKDTGQIGQIDKKKTYHLHRDPKTFEETPDKVYDWSWQNFEKWAEKEKKRPEMLLWQQQIGTDKKRLESEKAYAEELKHNAETHFRQLGDKKPEDMNAIEKETLEYANSMMKRSQLSLQGVREQEKRLEEAEEKNIPIADFGIKKTTDSYAEAGIWAAQESEKNQFVRKGKGAIHVGPEIGWPQYYGSHPKEFVNVILKSREEMVKKLTQKEIEGQKNPYFDPDINKKEAEKMAKEHIKGELDTSHLGMWLQNFRPELTWDKRVGEFKKWYKEQMEYLADENKKHDIIGQIQIVDSAGGAHGHLPPGQGILGNDIYEYMKILKEKGGYKGPFTSEGHEEEKFNQGRILSKAWETMGSPIGTGYLYGRPAPQFRDVRQSYANIAYGTTGIFQSYVPSNDFTLWSNVPLE